MAGVKISALPVATSSLFTDFFPAVQAGVTSQETLLQVATLFGFDSTTHLLSLSKGGTNANLTATANSLVYSTATELALLATGNNGVLITDNTGVPSISSTLPSAVQSNITHLGAQTQALNMNSHLINNVTDPLSPQDAATKAYVDAQSGAFLPLAGGTMSGQINMGSQKITNMADPTSAQDAVTLSYLSNQLTNYLALSGGTMSGVINMGSNKIINVTDPTNSQDAATKAYVDSVATGLTIQPACYAATTAALTATYANGASGIGATLTNSGALAQFTTDGTTPPTNARILVWNQASTLQNGIYTLTNQGSGAVNWVLTRATDYDQPSEIQPGDLVIINNGTLYGGSSFIETASVSAIGTDPILFSQFTFSATAVLLKANNLSDVANKTTSFDNVSPLTTKGDLIGYSSTNIRVAVGSTNGQILQVASGAASGLAWSTPTYPSTSGTSGKFLISDGTNNVYSTSTIPTSAGATANKVLLSDGTNYVLSTPTFPNASATTGKIIISDGTNWIASTPTYPAAAGSSGNVLTSDGTNWVSSTPTGVTWSTVTGTSQAAAVNNGYFANNSGLVTITLPATAAVGSTVEVAGQGSGGWKLAANTGQTIQFGNLATTSAGSFASTNQYDTIRVVCQVANTTWQVLSAVSAGLTKA